MKRKIAIMISLLLATSLFMFACGSGGSQGTTESQPNASESQPNNDSEETGVSNEPVSADTSAADVEHRSVSLVVNTVADLRALTVDVDDVTVTLLGYYEPGDGGQGIFYWNEKETNADNGGTFIKCQNEKGCFVRLCEEQERNVKWFGAKGDGRTDDYNAIQSAIDSLPPNGGTVSLPGGNYVVSKTINIGNGNAADNWSTKQGIALAGNGSGQGVHSSAVPTTIIASAPVENVISVNGLISGVTLKGLFISGNLKAKNGVFLHAFCGLYMNDIRITQFTEKGLYIMGGNEPTGNYNIYNRFDNVYVTSSHNGAECLYMDGDYAASNDTWLTTFTQCVFDTVGGTGSAAAHFRFVDSISFYSCRFTAGDNSVGIIFDALENKDFPSGIGFYSCSVSSTKVLEDDNHYIRKQYFYGFSTANGEIIPEHNRLIGITDTGVPFNFDEVFSGNSGGGSVSTLPGKKGVVDLFNEVTINQYQHYNLAMTRASVGVHVNCNGKLTGGKAYLPSYDNSIGTVHIKVYKWDTDYATSVSGEVLSYYDFVNFNENTWLSFEFSKQLDPGDYVVEFTAETEAGDYGCGIWAQARGSGVVTYYNGNEVDFGVSVKLDIK